MTVRQVRVAFLIGAFAAIFPLSLGFADGPRLTRPEARARPTIDEHIHLAKGDTLVALLSDRGLSTPEAFAWSKAASTAFDVRRMRPRRGLTLRFETETRKLRAIRYEIDDRSLLVIESNGGVLEARREALPYVTEVRGVAGTIARGLWEDLTAAGAPEEVAA